MDRRLASPQSSEQLLLDAETRHQKLDLRLKELGRRAYPTPTEQREMAEIKKRKLMAKDEIARLGMLVRRDASLR